MSFGQYIGAWFDWTIWSLFSSAIDMLDMYIGLLSGLAVAFLQYCMQSKPFVSFIEEMKKIGGILFVGVMTILAVYHMGSFKTTDGGKKLVNGICISVLFIIATPWITDLGMKAVQDLTPVASTMGSDTTTITRRGLANGLTSSTQQFQNYVASGKDCTGQDASKSWWNITPWADDKGNIYKGSADDGWVNGISLPFWLSEYRETTLKQWETMGLKPASVTSVFPNGGGAGGSKATAVAAADGGIVDYLNGESPTDARVKARYFNVTCAIEGENQGVIPIYQLPSFPILLLYTIVLFVVCITITFKLIDTILEIIMLSAIMPLTAAISMSDTGRQSFQNTVKEFAISCIGVVATVAFVSLMMTFLGNAISEGEGGGITYITNYLSGDAGGFGAVFTNNPGFLDFVQLLLKIIFLLAIGFFTINGSDAIKKILGFDTGMQGSYLGGMMAGAVLSKAGQVVGQAAGAATNVATAPVKKAGKALGNKAKEKVNEMKDGAKDWAKDKKDNWEAKSNLGDAKDRLANKDYDKAFEDKNLNANELADYRDMARDFHNANNATSFDSLSADEQEQLTKDMASGKTEDQMIVDRCDSVQARKDMAKESKQLRKQNQPKGSAAFAGAANMVSKGQNTYNQSKGQLSKNSQQMKNNINKYSSFNRDSKHKK